MRTKKYAALRNAAREAKKSAGSDSVSTCKDSTARLLRQLAGQAQRLARTHHDPTLRAKFLHIADALRREGAR